MVWSSSKSASTINKGKSIEKKLRPARVPPPGRTIRKELAARGWTQRYLAEQMGRPEQKISEIVSGKKRITEETALELEDVFEIDAAFWLNLEANFRLHLAREARSVRKAG